MSSGTRKSVTLWIADLLARGDPEAARQLYERHKSRMIRLARAKLRKWSLP
jgi:hypothetical protein